MADQLNLRSTTFTAGNSWLATYGTSLRNNDLYLGRCRWTSADPVLEQADCEQGALYAHATDALLYFYRIDGTGTADDSTRKGLAAPIRAIWHYDDRTGAPETDGRSKKGDLLIYDDATNDRYLAVCTGSATYGLGVRADYRTAATSGAGAKQHSDRVTWRASSWNGSAAKYREWRARSYVVTDASGADAWDWRLSRYAESGTERDVLQLSRNGELRLQGNADAAGIVLSSSLDGTGTVTGQFGYITSTSTDPDQAACVFVHGQATRRAIWRYKNPTTGYTGFNAETITLRPYEEASVGTQLVNSPAITLRGNYWNGASFTESGFYQQVVMTATTPTGYLEFGPNFGSGVYQFNHDGLLGIAGSSTGGILLSRYTAATNGSQLIDSSLLKFRGAYWTGAASADIDATTKLVTDATTPTAHLRSTFSSGVGIFDHYDDGAAVFHMDPAGASTYGGQLAIRPDTTSNASNPAIDSPSFSAIAHSGSLGAARVMGLYTKIDSSADASDQWSARFLAVGTGSAEALGIRSTGELVIADIAGHALEFETALGTHNKTTNADKTGNAKSGTIKIKANGTTYHIQLYADA